MAIAEQGALNRTFRSETKKRQLFIFDARPMKAAVGNTVMGAGFESDDSGYGFCKSLFLNIGMFSAQVLSKI
jgi:hypothetical protein